MTVYGVHTADGKYNTTGGTGGTGGATTIADGGDTAQGTTTDPLWDGTSPATEITLQKTLAKAALSQLPVNVDTVTKGTPTDRGSTITTGGTAQVLMAANVNRRGWSIMNLSTNDIFVNDVGTASGTGSGSMKIPSGALYESPVHQVSVAAISVFGATTGQAFYSREF